MKELSGRFVVRIPPELHAELQAEARRHGESLNRVCVRRLSAAERCSGPGSTTTAYAGIIPRSLLRRIRQRFAEELVGIILFGSTARGDTTEASDVDLLLVLAPGSVLSRELYRRWDALSIPSEPAEGVISPQFAVLPQEISDAGGLWYEVALEGIVLWERDWVVSSALRRIRAAMADGRLRRSTVHGSPYWVRNFEPAHDEK
jgi:predicted nucleotidyltransferase